METAVEPPATIPVESWQQFLAQVANMRELQVNYRLTLSPFTRKDMQRAEDLVDATVARFSAIESSH